MNFNLKDYEPVEDRLARFWADHPSGRVLTDLVAHAEGNYIVKASVWRHTVEGVVDAMGHPVNPGAPDATGYAQEREGSSPVNKTSALENCETSAIGRALANLGYAPKGQRPSREEMVKTQTAGGGLATGEGANKPAPAVCSHDFPTPPPGARFKVCSKCMAKEKVA